MDTRIAVDEEAGGATASAADEPSSCGSPESRNTATNQAAQGEGMPDDCSST